MSSAGSTGEETPDSEDDISLNDLSANHNNELFAGTVAGACVDSLANVDFKTLPPDELETEQIDNTGTKAKSRTKQKIQDEDKQYLLADNSEYAPVGDESANLWNKAMTTLAKGKCSKDEEKQGVAADKSNSSSSSIAKGDDGQLAPKKAAKPAFDMAPILMDEDIDGGKAAHMELNIDKKPSSGDVIPSSDYSIDGESAMLWGDDPEKAYFAYILEQEAEHRAMEGKDQDDSLVGESVRQELLNNNGNNRDASTFDEDSTTLGHGSKAMGWDPSTAGVGASAMGAISTLTPSHLASSQERAKNGQKVIPNVIYVGDGSNPNPQVESRSWKNKDVSAPEQARPSRSSNSAKNKTAPKEVDDGFEDPTSSTREPKSGWYTNRILIGFALFFLILTTGLVAALIVYRNHYAEDTTTTDSSNLDENGNPIMAPSQAPITFNPTISLDKKDAQDAEEDDDNEDATVPTVEPTWMPTGEPTWIPTRNPTFGPTAEPTGNPTWVPTGTPSFVPTKKPTRNPSIQPTETESGTPTEMESGVPTEIESDTPSQVPTVSPSKAPTTKKPSANPTVEPTRIALTPPGQNVSVPEVDETDDGYDIVIIDATFGSTTEPSDGTPDANAPTLTPTKAPSIEVPTIPTTKAPTAAPVAGARPPNATAVTLLPTMAPSNIPTTEEPTDTSISPTQAPTAATISPTQTPTAATISPTQTPSSIAPSTLTPTPQAPVPTYVALDTVRGFLLDFSPMSTPELFDPESAQFAALQWLAQWMASIPPRQLGRITKKRLVQRWSMAVLYLSLNGPNWLNGAEDWMGDDDVCDWIKDNDQGSCNRDDLVTTLDLSNNNLRGSLPNEISLLASMSRLEMDRNDITGPLPAQIGRLQELVSLDFTRCDLSGPLPTQLGSLSNLAILGLGRNDFVGGIPTEFGNLQNLVYLSLERNDLGGTLPLQLASLENLEYLAVDWNALTGEVPGELRNLRRLRTLILARNRLVGEMPDEFCDRTMDFMAADCDEVTCLCCDLCCVSGQGCAST